MEDNMQLTNSSQHRLLWTKYYIKTFLKVIADLRKPNSITYLYKRFLCIFCWNIREQLKVESPKFCPNLYDSAKQAQKSQPFRMNPFIFYDLKKFF